MFQLRIGYHRVSDDCVTSVVLLPAEIEQRAEDCMADPDIDHFWIRDATTMDVIYDSKDIFPFPNLYTL